MIRAGARRSIARQRGPSNMKSGRHLPSLHVAASSRRRRHSLPRQVLATRVICLSALAVALGCGRYDSSLLGASTCGDGRLGLGELCDTAIAQGELGACPVRCSSDDPCAQRALAGSGCGLHCEVTSIRAAINGDGCCPEGVLSSEDSDCGFCGDTIIGPAETCDPPESCLSAESCASARACVAAVFVGDQQTCDASCELRVITECLAGDRCCPPGCRNLDTDCSGACGDGIVDPDAGETCEPASESEACPRSCDDEDACTVDELKGRAATCDARCEHTPLSDAIDGDDCCLSGTSGVDDDDCATQCDADAGTCDELAGAAEMGAGDGDALCLDVQSRERMLPDRCARCACERCGESSLGCFFSGDSERDAECGAVVGCSRDTGCVGDDCFCGSSADCDRPDGACRDQLAAAAGGFDRDAIARCAADTSCAIYWSNRYSECMLRECAAPCST
jgi:hypothetical protein